MPAGSERSNSAWAQRVLGHAAAPGKRHHRLALETAGPPIRQHPRYPPPPPRRKRKRRLVLILALHLQNVEEIQSRGARPDPHLVGPGSGAGTSSSFIVPVHPTRALAMPSSSPPADFATFE